MEILVVIHHPNTIVNAIIDFVLDTKKDDVRLF